MGTQGRLNVGIFFNARREQGGLYQYALTLVDSLFRFVPGNEYFLFHATLEVFPLKLNASNWHFVDLPRHAVRLRMGFELLFNLMTRIGFDFSVSMIPEYRQIIKMAPDLMIFVKPTPQVFQWNYPSIFPIHDLQHRLQSGFPEVSNKGEYLRREVLYKNSIACASAILTDSEIGKKDVIDLYDVDTKKIFPLPYIAPTFRKYSDNKGSIQTIKEKYSLPNTFFFYPAAFWSHKNHLRLIKAIKLIENEHGIKLPLVLSGEKNREYSHLQAFTDEMGLKDTIHFIGYVPEDDLYLLYQHAMALVMPTFFGPTNIPVLEAWTNGCPVVTSDIRGIREQVGDAGLLVNPSDIQAIAKALWRIYKNPNLRADLIKKGRNRIKLWTPAMFGRKLSDIIHNIET
jgi:glycosyltransferase involved in cell wall biosynthesis